MWLNTTRTRSSQWFSFHMRKRHRSTTSRSCTQFSPTNTRLPFGTATIARSMPADVSKIIHRLLISYVYSSEWPYHKWSQMRAPRNCKRNTEISTISTLYSSRNLRQEAMFLSEVLLKWHPLQTKWLRKGTPCSCYAAKEHFGSSASDPSSGRLIKLVSNYDLQQPIDQSCSIFKPWNGMPVWREYRRYGWSGEYRIHGGSECKLLRSREGYRSRLPSSRDIPHCSWYGYVSQSDLVESDAHNS